MVDKELFGLEALSKGYIGSNFISEPYERMHIQRRNIKTIFVIASTQRQLLNKKFESEMIINIPVKTFTNFLAYSYSLPVSSSNIVASIKIFQGLRMLSPLITNLFCTLILA